MWKNLYCVVCGKLILFLFKQRSSPIASWDREPLCPPAPLHNGIYWHAVSLLLKDFLVTFNSKRGVCSQKKVKRKTRCEAICQSETISSLSRSSLLSMIVHVWLMRMRYWDRTEIRNAYRVKQLCLPCLDGVVMALRLKSNGVIARWLSCDVMDCKFIEGNLFLFLLRGTLLVSLKIQELSFH